MRILFISAAYPPNYTGIGAYTFNMAQALARAGHRVVIATSTVSGLPEEETNHLITVCRCYSINELRTTALAQKLLTLAQQMKIDIIECADFLGEAGKILRLPRTIPVCIKAHNSGPVKAGREAEIHFHWQRWMQWAAIIRNWSQYREEKYSLEHGDILTTPSQRLLTELELQGLSLPARRFVQANPVNLPDTCPDNLEDAQPTVLFVGRLAIGKGIAFLPDFLIRLIKDFPSLRMVIAGSDSYNRGLGSLRQWLSRQFAPHLDNVEFTGHLNRKELQRQYDRAWLIIVPSLWDTFPTVVLEAMAQAKPVVGSTYGGIPEMLENTLCTTAPPSSPLFINEIEKLLRDRELRIAAGRSMYIKAQQYYHPEIIAEQFTRKLSSFLP